MVDWTKPVQTRDGRAVRVLCTDAKGSPYPVIALLIGSDGSEVLDTFTEEGKAHSNAALSRNDLVNVPEREVRYVNWYTSLIWTVAVCMSRAEADRRASSSSCRGAVLRVTIEDGIPIAVDIERVSP